jgi:toxin ParE1/3/4
VTRRRSVKLLLTDRALRDLQGIERYSVEEWGRDAAEKYLADLEAGLQRVRENPRLLQPNLELHESLRFYRVKKHLLVCDVQSNEIVVLTVIHATMDIPSRLAELQPSLGAEVGFLSQVRKRRRRRKR